MSPVIVSPGTIEIPHCSFKFIKVNPDPEIGRAHSGFSGSTKKLTSLRDEFVVVNDASIWLVLRGQLRFVKWTDSM